MRSNLLRAALMLSIIAALLAAPQVASGTRDGDYWAGNWKSVKVLAASRACRKKSKNKKPPCSRATATTTDSTAALALTDPTAAPAPTPPTPTEPTPETTEPAPTDPIPEPTPTGAPAIDWPGPHNTGVPADLTLKPYDGPCIYRESDGSSVVIDGYDVRATCGELMAYHPFAFTIRNSRVPRVEVTGPGQSVDISDSDVVAGGFVDGALWGSNITATRVEVTGGQHSVHCMSGCTIVDSWLHDQYNPDGESYHTQPFLTNGGSHMVLRGNTLHCDSILNATGGGCTADVSLFGDFDPVSDVLVERNLLKANNSSISFCAYGGHSPGKAFPDSTHIRYIDNVFERGVNGKCGVYGPVTSFDTTAPGNVWSGNVWDSGEPVPSSD